MAVTRDRRLSLKITDEERGMLEALSTSDGVTVSSWVRLMVRRAYAEKFGKKKPPKPPR